MDKITIHLFSMAFFMAMAFNARGDCPTYSPPISGTEACATAPYLFEIPSTDCPKTVTWTVEGNAGSQFGQEFSWQITNLTTGLIVATSGNFGNGNIYADGESFNFTIGPDPSVTVGSSYNLEVNDSFGDGFNGTGGFIAVYDYEGNEITRIDGNFGASANQGFAAPEYVSDVTYSITTSAGTTTGTLVFCQNLVEEITFANSNFCTTTTENVAWDLVCTETGASIQSGNMDIIIYPDVPAAASDLVTITPDATNCGWEVTTNGDCDIADYGAMFTIDPDPATTTYNPGDNGNELFTVTYTGFSTGPDCCAVGGPPVNQTFTTPAPTSSAVITDSPFGGTNNSALLSTGPAGSGGQAISGSFDLSVSGYSYPDANRPNTTDASGTCQETVTTPNFWTTIYVDGILVSDELVDPIAGTIATANPSGVPGTASVGGYDITISFADIQEDGVTFDENSVIEAYVYPNSFNGPSQPCGGAQVTTTFDKGGALDDPGEWDAATIEIANVNFVFQETEPGPRDCTLETTEAYNCPPNQAPVADDDTNMTVTDTPVSGDVSPNDADPDGQTLAFSDAADGDGTIITAQGGTVSMNVDGTYTYTPPPGFEGTDAFIYQACDPGGLCDAATVTISIDLGCVPVAGTLNNLFTTPVQRNSSAIGPLASLVPMANDDVNTTIKNTPVSGDVSINDTEPDGFSMAYSDPADGDGIIATAQGGTVSMNVDGTYTYTPPTGFDGTDTYVYQACNFSGACDNATVTITVNEQCLAGTGTANGICDYAVGDDISIANTGYNMDVGTAQICYLVDDSGTIIQTDTDNTGNCDFTSIPYGNFNVYALNDCAGGVNDVAANPPADEAAIIALGAESDVDVVGPSAITVCDPSVTTANCGDDIFLSSAPDYNMANNQLYVLVCDDNIEAVVTVAPGNPGEATLTTPNPAPAAGCTGYIVNHCPAGDASAIVPNASWAAVAPSPDTDNFDVVNVPLTVNCVLNEPPVANDDADTTDEDTAVTTTVTANDSDPDADLDPTSVSITSQPLNGTTVSNGDGTITYTPAPDFNGWDTYEYQVCDMTTPTPLCDVAAVTITVTPVNDPPVAVDDTATTPEDTPVTTTVVANDSDLDGVIDPTSVTVTTQPANGTAISNGDGTVTYTPDPDFVGTDTYTYQVCDTGTPTPVECVTAEVVITVNPVNDAPVANDDIDTTLEDMPITTTVTTNDSDPDGNIDPASVTLTTPPTNGTAVSNGDGTVTYTPNPDFNGTDTYAYQVCDDGQFFVLCDEAEVTITVDPVNDPPVTVDDNDFTIEDTPVTIPVLANDSDIDGAIDPTSVTIPTLPANGTVTVNTDGTVTYTPATGFNGNDTFEYNVCDDGTPTPPMCSTRTVTVSVGATNNPPVAVDDTDTTPEDTPVTTTVVANDSDSDAAIDPASVTLTTQPTNGTAISNGDGTVTYTPNPDFNGTDTYTYQVCDTGTPLPVLCDEAEVTITVDPVNDPPVANDDFAQVDENNAVNILVSNNDTDPDGGLDVSAVTIVNPPSNGSAAVNPDGSISYSPNAGFDGTDQFDYQICDSSPPTPLCDIATVFVNVIPVNDPPVAKDDFSTTTENQAVTTIVTVNDSDPDGDLDLNSITIATAPANGTATFLGNGEIEYTPAANFVGTDTYSYQICDSSNPPLCDDATVTITVEPEPDPIVIIDDTEVTNEDTPVTTAVLANDNDPEGDLDPGTVTVTTPPVNGTTIVNSDGTISYTPNPEFSGTDSYTYQVCEAAFPDLFFIVQSPSGGNASTVSTIGENLVINEVSQVPVAINGLGYNHIDNRLYGMNDDNNDGVPQLYRVKPNGDYEELTTVNPPPPGNFGAAVFWFVGDIDQNGIYHFPAVSVNSINPPDYTVYLGQIDLNTSLTTPSHTPSYSLINTAGACQPYVDAFVTDLIAFYVSGGNGTMPSGGIQDWAFNPNDGLLYSYMGNEAVVFTMDLAGNTNCYPTSNTALSEFGAVFFDEQDRLYGIDSNTGNAYLIDISNCASGTNCGTLTPIGNLPGNNRVDGASASQAGFVQPTFCGEAVVTVTVQAVNDPPIVQDNTSNTDQDTPVSTAILANDSDIDGNIDPNTFAIATPPANGTVSFDPTTLIATYVPDAGFCGTDSYIYEVCDDGTPLPAECGTATVTIVVDCIDVCQQTGVGSTLSTGSSNPNTTCCYDIDISNGAPDHFTALQLTAQGGITLYYDNISPSWALNAFGTDYVQLVPTNSAFAPTGQNQNLIRICLDDYTADVQNVEIDWYGPDYQVECTDNLEFNCGNCADVSNDALLCNLQETVLEFYIHNPIGTGYPIQSYHIDAISGGTIASPYEVISPIPEGSTAGPFYATVVPDNPIGSSFCYAITVHSDDITVNPTAACCKTETYCLAMPVCDPCLNIDLTYQQDPADCSIDVQLINNYAYTPDYFIGIETEVLTPGVYFESINNFPGSGWSINSTTAPYSYDNVQWNLVAPTNGFLPQGTTILPNFTLGGYAPGPQEVEVRWIGVDGIICRDILVLNCIMEDPPEECAEIIPDEIFCGPNGDYFFHFYVTNNSTEDFNSVTFHNYSAPNVKFEPNPKAIPSLAPGQTSDLQSVTVLGTDALPGSTICYQFSVHNYNQNDVPTFCCTPDETYCITLPICDPCAVDNTGNDAPVAQDDAYTIDEGVQVELDLLANDCDADNSLSYCNISVVNGPANGTVELLTFPCRVNFTPDQFFCGTDVFTYEICDDDNSCDVGQVLITVNCVNTPPVAKNDGTTTFTNTSVTIDVLANDFDVDGNLDPATLTLGQPDFGTASLSSGQVVYTPNSGFNGTDAFTYTICDDGSPTPSACATGQVGVRVVSSPRNPSISLRPNPLQTTGYFDYELIEAGEVSLVIHDPLGRNRVYLIEAEYQEAGLHSKEFDASDLIPGLYYYTLEVDGKRTTKQTLVIR